MQTECHKRVESNKVISHHRTSSSIKERQTLAKLEKLSHPTLQATQVLGVGVGKKGEFGFLLESAFPLELEELPCTFLRFDQHRDESE